MTLLDGVGIEQHLEAMLPLDTSFLGAGGDEVALGDYFDGERPTILTLNYVDCPQLCSMQLSKLTEAMAAIDLNLGEDYRVLTVSIDPRDTPEKAAGSEERYLSDYVFVSDKLDITRPDPAGGWSYLVGDKLEIDRGRHGGGLQLSLGRVPGRVRPPGRDDPLLAERTDHALPRRHVRAARDPPHGAPRGRRREDRNAVRERVPQLSHL